jgi:hypothetical protein
MMREQVGFLTMAATDTPRWTDRLPDGSRSVQSPWVWRGFVFMAFIALGLSISFIGVGAFLYAIAWAVIAVGWFAVGMWLWRKHVRDDDEARRTAQRGAK